LYLLFLDLKDFKFTGHHIHYFFTVDIDSS
jgi:hypothetical protein